MPRKRKPKIVEGEEFFNEFWAEWVDGRRVESPSVRTELKKLNPDDELKKKIMDGLRLYKAYWKRKGTELEHIPSPRKWIRNRRWEDDIPGFSEPQARRVEREEIYCPDCGYHTETPVEGRDVAFAPDNTLCIMCPGIDGPFYDESKLTAMKIRKL